MRHSLTETYKGKHTAACIAVQSPHENKGRFKSCYQFEKGSFLKIQFLLYYVVQICIFDFHTQLKIYGLGFLVVKCQLLSLETAFNDLKCYH